MVLYRWANIALNNSQFNLKQLFFITAMPLFGQWLYLGLWVCPYIYIYSFWAFSFLHLLSGWLCWPFLSSFWKSSLPSHFADFKYDFCYNRFRMDDVCMKVALLSVCSVITVFAALTNCILLYILLNYRIYILTRGCQLSKSSTASHTPSKMEVCTFSALKETAGSLWPDKLTPFQQLQRPC